MNSSKTPTCLLMHKWKHNWPMGHFLPVMLGSRLRPLWSLQWTKAASKSHCPNRWRMLLTLGRAGAGRGRDSQLLWLGLERRVGEDEGGCCCCCCCCWDALVGWLPLLCRIKNKPSNVSLFLEWISPKEITLRIVGHEPFKEAYIFYHNLKRYLLAIYVV